jgi:galactose oxidase
MQRIYYWGIASLAVLTIAIAQQKIAATRLQNMPLETLASPKTFVSAKQNILENAKLGTWDAPRTYPLVPVAAAFLPSGDIMMWSSFDALEQSSYKDIFGRVHTTGGSTQTAMFNPQSSAPIYVHSIKNTLHNMFCPGTSMLSDGQLMVVGGIGNEQDLKFKATSIFNFQNTTLEQYNTPNAAADKNGWKKGAPLNRARAYNTATTLFDGRVFTLGGTFKINLADETPLFSSAKNTGRFGEIWSSSTGWTALPDTSSMVIRREPQDQHGSDDLYAGLIPSPNGQVLLAGPNSNMYWYGLHGTGSTTWLGHHGIDPFRQNGIVVTYEANDKAIKVLKAGGADSDTDGPVYALAHKITLIGKTTQVKDEPIASMNHARVYANSVVLPSGEVFVVGGRSQLVRDRFDEQFSVLIPEIWNPITEQWTDLATMNIARNYHSVALLLQDARVWVAGGGFCPNLKVRCSSTNHPNSQTFNPPYLFNTNGTLATRPQIKTAPKTIGYAKTFVVSTNQEIQRFSMIRLSSVTHSVNTDQRFIDLELHGSKNTYSLKSPSQAVAIPGYYFLFALNKQGVPSVAKIIQIKL